MINQTAKKILKALSFDGVEVEAFRHMADLKRLDPMKIFYKKIDEKIYNGSHAVPIRIFFPTEKSGTQWSWFLCHQIIFHWLIFINDRAGGTHNHF